MYQLIGSPYTVAERFVAADLWHSVCVCAWIIYGVCNDSVYVRVCVQLRACGNVSRVLSVMYTCGWPSVVAQFATWHCTVISVVDSRSSP